MHGSYKILEIILDRDINLELLNNDKESALVNNIIIIYILSIYIINNILKSILL